MSEGSLVLAPGWYGKLPALGDFAARRLPRSFIQPWDGWLQQAMHADRARLGDAWLEAYLHAPMRRFVLARGVVDDSAWAGVLTPSVDRVGRHFPLTLARALPAPPATAWFDALEEAALGALDLAATVEDLEHVLATIAPPVPAAAAGLASGTSCFWTGEAFDRGWAQPGMPAAAIVID